MATWLSQPSRVDHIHALFALNILSKLPDASQNTIMTQLLLNDLCQRIHANVDKYDTKRLLRLVQALAKLKLGFLQSFPSGHLADLGNMHTTRNCVQLLSSIMPLLQGTLVMEPLASHLDLDSNNAVCCSL